MTRVIAVANQKGGVAKTTTVHALGVAMAEAGSRVLLVDLDPQACLTFSCGIEPDDLDRTIHDVLVGHTSDVASVRIKTADVHLLPANIDLAGSEIHLMTRTGREFTLARLLEPLLGDYDIVLLDCPPSLGLLTINGLTAAQEVVIPLPCETLSRRGLEQLLETVGDVKQYTNPDLVVTGVIATLFDARTNLTETVLGGLDEDERFQLLTPPIPKSVRVAEAPGTGKTVLHHAPRSKPALAYRELATKLLEAK